MPRGSDGRAKVSFGQSVSRFQTASPIGRPSENIETASTPPPVAVRATRSARCAGHKNIRQKVKAWDKKSKP
ncbi:hypothetical protein ACLD9W_08290 [Neisseria sp. WLZKY-1]|uniref:hypothetical protein n=1 Tax=Neisseria sp. WLZKY-1 TaxID=3390377 RepID=UPI00397AFA64